MGEKNLNIKSTGIISAAIMCSRLLGLAREVLFNALFGTSSMGIFLIAFRAPNLLRDLFAEGVLSISFVTVFSKKIEMEGESSAWLLASKMMTLSAVLMSVLSVLGIIFSHQLIGMLAPDFSGQDARITILLTQIMYPFILLISLAALVMGMLNSKNIFGVPALASSFFNIGSILGGILFGWLIDPHFGEKGLIGLAIGTVVGGFLQLSVQIPSLRRAGFHFKPNFHWNDPGVRQILILTIPGIIAASALQMNVLINSSFASHIGKEAVTWLNSAFRLIQFPIGIFGVAVSTITLPVISRIATTKNHAQFGETLGRAMRFVVFLTMPAVVGFYFFARPVISLIYEHGKFSAEDSLQTANALQFYAMGLIFYSCIKVLSPGFYAINKKWMPMCVSFISILINLFLNYFLVFVFRAGHCSLAFSATISSGFNFLTLYFLMNRSYQLQSDLFLSVLIRCGIASMMIGAVGWTTLFFFNDFIYSDLFLVRAFSLMLVLLLSGVVYLLACFLLRVEFVESVLKHRSLTVAAL